MSDTDDTFDTDEDLSPQRSSSLMSGLQRYLDGFDAQGIIDTIQFVSIWKIEQFSRFENSPCCHIESPKFTELNGHLVLHPQGVSENETAYMGLSLTMPSNTKLWYRFSIIDKNQKVAKTVEGEHHFRRHWNPDCIIPQFISKKDLVDQKADLLVDDTLNIVCELNFSNDVKLDCQNYEHTSALASDLRTLYDNQEFSDIKLLARGKVFHAHKNILASRSSVFAAMFRHKMKENMENVVPIKDVRIKVLKEMLHYMYTGSVRDMKMNTAQDLLIVAEKYDIPGLKKITGKVLEKKLTVDNAINILILADSHNAIDLKKSTVDFLAANIKDVMGTKAFKIALNSHLTLVINTIEKIINLRVA